MKEPVWISPDQLQKGYLRSGMLPGLFLEASGRLFWIPDLSPDLAVDLRDFTKRQLRPEETVLHGLRLGPVDLWLDRNALTPVGEVTAVDGDLILGDGLVRLRAQALGSTTPVEVAKLGGTDSTERQLICGHWKLVQREYLESAQILFERNPNPKGSRP